MIKLKIALVSLMLALSSQSFAVAFDGGSLSSAVILNVTGTTDSIAISQSVTGTATNLDSSWKMLKSSNFTIDNSSTSGSSTRIINTGAYTGGGVSLSLNSSGKYSHTSGSHSRSTTVPISEGTSTTVCIGTSYVRLVNTNQIYDHQSTSYVNGSASGGLSYTTAGKCVTITRPAALDPIKTQTATKVFVAGQLNGTVTGYVSSQGKVVDGTGSKAGQTHHQIAHMSVDGVGGVGAYFSKPANGTISANISASVNKSFTVGQSRTFCATGNNVAQAMKGAVWSNSSTITPTMSFSTPQVVQGNIMVDAFSATMSNGCATVTRIH